jgi:hypothetical protein
MMSDERGQRGNSVGGRHPIEEELPKGNPKLATGLFKDWQACPDGSSLGILFAYYEFICLISYGYDTAAIRFCFFYMPTIS